MSSRGWLEYLLPDEEEKDPRFRAQIDRLSVIGLRIIAGVCVSGVLYYMGVGLFLPAGFRDEMGGRALPLVILTLGALSMGASFWGAAKPYARWAGMLVGYGVAVTQFLSLASIVERPEVGYFLFSGIVTGVMLIGIAALPLKPMHVLVLGAAIAGTYGIAMPWVVPELSEHRAIELVFVAQVVLLCTALTVVVYRQRVLGYRARRSAREALNELRSAQARLLVSENAHSQSRFVAALSHELNTPLGALTSALDTLLQVFKKEPLALDARYAEIVAGAEAAGRGSAARLRETIARMSYLTNLDRAEEQTVDLNELCRETATSLKADLEPKADIDFDLGALPRVRCRPQQLSAVLANLLRNAAAAIEERGRITVRTRKQNDSIVVEVRDTGRGIPPNRLRTLFEPGFHVHGGRVATTNWSLFICRTIVTEHGGTLEIESEPGKGTTATITLPSV